MAAAAKDAPPPLWHEVQEQMPGLRYCINDNPVWPEAVILGFQHYIVNLGTIVIFTNTIVPLMGGDNNDKARVLETILFVSGVNTLIQTTIGSRLPVVMGISFAYIVPIISVINDGNLQTIADPQTRFKDTMRAVQGALIVPAFLNIVLGFSGVWGILTRILGPITIAPVVILTALGLYPYGFPYVAKCVELGLPTIVLTLLFSQYCGIFVLR
jgi:xanthine/uracil permease